MTAVACVSSVILNPSVHDAFTVGDFSVSAVNRLLILAKHWSLEFHLSQILFQQAVTVHKGVLKIKLSLGPVSDKKV